MWASGREAWVMWGWGQLGCPFLLQALSPVSTVTVILCIQVGEKAASLGTVYPGVPLKEWRGREVTTDFRGQLQLGARERCVSCLERRCWRTRSGGCGLLPSWPGLSCHPACAQACSSSSPWASGRAAAKPGSSMVAAILGGSCLRGTQC